MILPYFIIMLQLISHFAIEFILKCYAALFSPAINEQLGNLQIKYFYFNFF